MSELSEFHRERVKEVMAASPLIPVITIDKLETAVPLCRALYDGGLRVLEITLRTPAGLAAIGAVREALPDAWVGAGTVTTVKQYREAEAAGSQFVITPGVTDRLLEWGMTTEAPLLPGISTVSELMMAYCQGYRSFKFFPAAVSGGVGALKAFGGPFPDVDFCPTGGIRRHTAAEYLALDNVVTVGGTWLTPPDLIEAGDWDAISEEAAGSLADIRG